MTDGAHPTIEFPCEYPIKVIGVNAIGFKEEVVDLMRPHAPGIDARRVTVRESRAGAYCSVTVTIWATGVPQLRRIHEDLKEHPHVKMVL